MRFAAFSLVLLSLSAASTHAQPRTSSFRTSANGSVTTTASAAAPEAGSSSRFWLDGTLASLEDKFHIGVLGRFESPLDPGVFALLGGGHVGFLMGTSNPRTWMIPVQGELTYEFAESKGMTPYFGIATGLTVFRMASTKVDLPKYEFFGVTYGGGSIGADASTAVKFTALFRPGLRIGQNAHVELPLGSLGGGLYVSVAAGGRF